MHSVAVHLPSPLPSPAPRNATAEIRSIMLRLVLAVLPVCVAAQVEVRSLGLKNDYEACTYSSQDSCDADAGCTWCLCGALPSKCWTLEDSKKLPAGVYICDKTSAPSPPAPVAVKDACSESDEDSCNADAGCTWCKCGALPSKCWTLEDSKKLPAGVYICDKTSAPPAPVAVKDACSEPDEDSCNADAGCTWCKCGALPSKCWTLEDSKKLPAGVYICDKTSAPSPPAPVAVKDACSESDEDSCNADAGCTWCKCGALPSKCWTLEDSKKLPAGVYICDKTSAPPAPVAVKDACTYSSQDSCDADAGCTWCLCGALPSKCWTLEDSKKLPAGVYICDKTSAPSPPAPVAVKDACSEPDQDSCDADAGCTWCKCGALPSKCWTLEDSKKLPAGVYICDKTN